MFRRWLRFAFGAAIWLESPGIRADPVAAEGLFREARALLEGGNIDAARENFEASSAIEPSSGTLLDFTICRLKQGRAATAWAPFSAAARSARAQNRPAVPGPQAHDERIVTIPRLRRAAEPEQRREPAISLNAPGGDNESASALPWLVGGSEPAPSSRAP